MGIQTRKFDRGYKALLHFDYPYFAEPGDGMRDEIGQLEWKSAGNAKFVGTEIPVAANVANTPLFGYRCLQTAANTDYIAGTKSDYMNLDASKAYEFECFIRKTSAAAGNIINILNNNGVSVFVITSDANNYITVTSSALGISGTSTATVTLNTWTHIRVRINEGAVSIFINGSQAYEGTCSGTLTDTLSIRLGGFAGQMDEFLFRRVFDGNFYNTVPSAPYQGYLHLRGIGGTGRQGTLNLTTGTSYLNTYYLVSTIQNASNFTITALNYQANSIGIHGQAQVGDEVMIYKKQKDVGNIEPSETGLYTFRKIKAINGLSFTLDAPITDFTFADDDKFYYIVVFVPNYTQVTIGANATVNVAGPYNVGGGICAFRSKGNVTINGKIITSGLGPTRYDYYQMTHNDLPERFIMNKGGGIIILSEGTVTAGDNARLGATWSGAGKGGAGVQTNANYDYVAGNAGGSGYGGSGGAGHKNNRNVVETSFPGNVGRGGNSINVYGSNATRGQWNGANPLRMSTVYGHEVANSGANVLIICKTLAISMNAISTGGQGGQLNSYDSPSGGGGTGMCYLAYEEAI